jgi:TRAP transporter 4TM/12TM fusion protein
MIADRILGVICFVWLVLQVGLQFVYSVNPLLQRYLFLIFSLLVLFYPLGTAAQKRLTGPRQRVFEYVLFLLSLALGLYLFLNSTRYVERMQFVDEVSRMDIVASFVLLFILVAGTLRGTGWSLPGLVLVMVAYGFFGEHLPGFFQHGGISLADATEVQLMTFVGTFGIAAGVCVEYVFYFIVFGALFEAVGGGDLLVKLGMILTNRTIGGPAKSAVVASSFFGTVSGSAVANVVGTGTFTIPLMKRTGVQPHVAGAIEAAASTGGQLMPPVMGAGAFVMAEVLGVPYLAIVKAAILPAICYYVALYFYVHYYSKRMGLGKTSVPVTLREILERAHLLIPLGFLIYFIVIGQSVAYAVVRVVGILLIVSLLSKKTRPTLSGLATAIRSGMEQSASVGVPIFICGVIIGVAIHSGIAMKSTSLIVGLGKEMLLPSLLLGILITIILGMGLPTVAAYVVASLFVCPPLVKNGVLPLGAHLFVFYYSILAQITPPVAMAAYAGAGIAKTDPVKTGWTAFFISLVAFLIPFAFIYDPSLLLAGPLSLSAYSFGKTVVGCYLLALALAGHHRWGRAHWASRGAFMIAAVLLITPSLVGDAVGFVIGAVALVAEYRRSRATAPPMPAEGDGPPRELGARDL